MFVHLYCRYFIGLPLVSEFLVVLWIISRKASSRGDRGKAPIYATTHRDDSSDDETVSTSEQVT